LPSTRPSLSSRCNAVDISGQPVLRRNLRRRELLAFFEKLAPVEMVLEARGGSHHWGAPWRHWATACG